MAVGVRIIISQLRQTHSYQYQEFLSHLGALLLHLPSIHRAQETPEQLISVEDHEELQGTI